MAIPSTRQARPARGKAWSTDDRAIYAAQYLFVIHLARSGKVYQRVSTSAGLTRLPPPSPRDQAVWESQAKGALSLPATEYKACGALRVAWKASRVSPRMAA